MKKTGKFMTGFAAVIMFIMIASVFAYAAYVASPEKSKQYGTNTYYGQSICESLADGSSAGTHPEENMTPFEDSRKAEYKVNESGQTYGSEIFASSREYVPDLIWAVGIDGTEGYIKKEELYSVIDQSYEEVVSGVNNSDALIPLYESDGKTVIGSFLISAARSVDNYPAG